MKDARRRHERDGNVLRETFIRWLVPVVLAALVAALGFKLIKGRATQPLAPAERRDHVPPAADATPTH